jgi:hypothetical protein
VLKDIYLLLTDTHSLLSRFIKLFNRQTYNHISVSLNEDLTELYSFGRKKPTNPFNGGFINEDVTTPFYRHADCQIYRCEVTDEQYAALQQAIAAFQSEKESYHYNLLGLATAFFGIDWNRKHHYFCSEFVSCVLRTGTILETAEPNSLTRPQDIIQHLSLHPVYEGILGSYPRMGVHGLMLEHNLEHTAI